MYIKREEYLDKLIGFKDKQIIKVVTGVRRCGKSTLFKMYQDYLVSVGVKKEQIIAFNFEDYAYDNLIEPKELYRYIESKLLGNNKSYIFLDEIQNVRDFPRVIDSLYLKENVDIYLTGSNAYMLSSDISTLLTGRYVEIKMLPLSFKEYVSSTGDFNNLQSKYKDYIESTSFPFALELKKPDLIKDYMEGLLNTIINKDVVNRNKITDIMVFQSILRYVFDNIGSQLSSKKIADTLTSNGRKIDSKTIEKYLSWLKDSFIIYEAKRFNIKGKEYLKTLEKYYVVDIGLRRTLLGNSYTDIGHILENVIYLELIRRNYKVSIGKINDLEIDFVAQNYEETIYIQVAATLRDATTLKREITSLEKIDDHYQKIILTLDEDPSSSYNGIKIINALEWLVGKSK